MKKYGIPAFAVLIIGIAYMDSLKRCDIEAEESRHFVEQVNAQEDQFDAELQFYVERNKALNEGQAHAIDAR